MSNFRFADDIVLFASDVKELEQMIVSLNEEGKKDGMKINKSKTKISYNIHVRRASQNSGIIIDGEELDSIEQYVYLEQLITADNNESKEIARQIGQGWASFGKYNNILRDTKIPISLKRKIMDNIVTPAMTYSAETWSSTNKLASQLQVAQRSMERAMLNITRRDRKRNEWIQKQTKVLDIIAKAKSLKWEWAGDIGRVADNRWAKKCTEWTPYERKRSRGRPRKRWRGEIVEKQGSIG